MISGDWHGWWVYWLGPLIDTLVAVAGYRFGGFDRGHVEVAKIWHFEHDPHGIFHGKAPRTSSG